MDLDTLYQDLFRRYISSKRRNDYEKEVEKLSDFLAKNKYNGTIDGIDSSYVPYPEYDDTNFNKKVYNKKEFNPLTQESDQDALKNAKNMKEAYENISKQKCSQTSFRLTANQKFVKNFMSPLTPYNGILLYHGVGVGKTCTAISIAEQYHQLYQKKVLVILSSTLIENFKKQLFDITKYDITTNRSLLCTGTAYPDLILEKQYLKPDVLEKKINKIISDRYQFIGYKKLVSYFSQTMEKVKKQEKDVSKHEKLFYDKIKEAFSNRLIIIDEAHNLRNPSEKGTKQTATTFWKLLKFTENVKLVLLTATPMFNNANEIVWMVNLLLTNDKRPNIKTSDIFDSNGVLTTQGKAKLIEAARGYVSYMRGENPFSFPFRIYPSINNDKNVIRHFPSKDITGKPIKDDEKVKYLEIIGSDMSQYQKSVYNAYKRKVSINDTEEDAETESEDKSDANDDEALGTDLQTITQISNIVYPVDSLSDPNEYKKSVGKPGFTNVFVNSAKKGTKWRYTSECLEKYGEILSYGNIGKFAPKMKRIIDYILNSKGIVFVYSQYYWSGIHPLAVALEHIGFAKYNASNIANENITVDNKFEGKRRPTYVILSRDTDLSPNNDKEIEIVKSKENANGDIVKVIIASRIASEGIDFKRIREVHILEPWYNLNRSEQIIGRAVRNCSHIDMPIEDRNVTIYFHACQYDDKEESIDLRTYRIAEKKQKRITEVERILKETAVDCNLNKRNLSYNAKELNINIPLRTSQRKLIRSYSVGDKDYTYVCNYSKCQLKCNPDINSTDVKSSKRDETTYDPRFILDEISLYKLYIASLYKHQINAFTYEDILRTLQGKYKTIDEEVLVYALQDMIDEKTPIYDSDNIRGFIIYRSNKYIFQNAMLADKRMSLAERANFNKITSRVKLDINALKTKLANKQLNASSKGSMGFNSNTNGAVEIKDILQYVNDEYNTHMTFYNENGVDLTRYDKYVIDSIVDRLENIPLVLLIENIAKLQSTGQHTDVSKKVLRSLLEAGILLMDDKDMISYFYNHHDGDMYCLRSDEKFRKCSPIELNKVSKEVSSLKQKMTNDMEETVKGHIEFSGKKSGCDFKVRDNPKTSGYVCWKTSSLSLEELLNRIKSVDTNLKLDNLIKKDMCFIYELTLRSQGKKAFKRSVVKKLK